MTYQQAKDIISKLRPGTIHTLTYRKTLKTRPGITDKVTKVTQIQVRFGVSYDNIRQVMDARNNLSLPIHNAGLPTNLEWKDKNFLHNKAKDTILLRATFANGYKTQSQYYLNGKPVGKADIETLCYKSETTTRSDPLIVFNIGVENILSIK